MHRSTASRIVRAIKAPVPTHGGGTLYVEGVPADKWDDKEFIRNMVALHALRVAFEKGCVKIVVRHPARSPIEFDVVDLILNATRRVGYWPVPRHPMPVGIATASMLARGAELAPARPTFTVPTAFPALTPAQGG